MKATAIAALAFQAFLTANATGIVLFKVASIRAGDCIRGTSPDTALAWFLVLAAVGWVAVVAGTLACWRRPLGRHPSLWVGHLFLPIVFAFSLWFFGSGEPRLCGSGLSTPSSLAFHLNLRSYEDARSEADTGEQS